jgi:hypothetical protein
MERTVAIYHEGAIARYNVFKNNDGGYTARLLMYGGNSKNEPPKEVQLHRNGQKWEDKDIDQSLVQELGNSIEYEFKSAPQPDTSSRDFLRGEDEHRP